VTVESVTYISDLNVLYPETGTGVSDGDDHLRNIKTALKNSFPNVNGAVSATDEQLSGVSPAFTGTATATNLQVSTTLTYGGQEVGFRDLVPVVVSGADNLALTYRDKILIQTGTGDLTVPAGVFTVGNVVDVLNHTALTVTLAQGGGLTLRLAGSTSTGSRTLAARAWARVFFTSDSEAYVWGVGVT
jgi:hypothetical protein